VTEPIVAENRFAQHPEILRSVVAEVLSAADPAEAVVRNWPSDPAFAERLKGGMLVAAGKASMAMARAAVERCGVRPSVGVVITATGTKCPPVLHAAGVRVFEADHPLPSQRNLIAARAASDAARLASSRRLPLLTLISGGASAHLTFPQPGITLSDIRAITDALMRAGATIAELNVVRTCLEQLKGGGLARLASPSPVYSMILSDVLGDSVKVIASGPTADGRPMPDKAMRVMEIRRVMEAAPSVTAKLKAMLAKPAPPPPAVENATNLIVGSNAMAVVSARDTLEKQGFAISEARMHVDGESRLLGEAFAGAILRAKGKGAGKPVALVWGGETTVTVGAPTAGHGGRNQEAALAAAIALAGHQNVAAMFLATDGVDGVAPAGGRAHGGALVTGESVAMARAAGVDAAKALAKHDSYSFVRALESANPGERAVIPLGPTGTNVNDLWVGLAY
jgi:hydroxypyruvate reductase